MKDLIKKIGSLPKDKILHFLLGYFAFYVGALIGKFFLRRNFLLVGLCFAGIVGIAKEIWDSRGNGNVEIKDFLATFFGGLVEFIFRNIL